MSSDEWLYYTTQHNGTIALNVSSYNMTGNSTLVNDNFSMIPAPEQILSWCFFVLLCFAIRPSIPDASYRTAQRTREQEERLAEMRKDPKTRKRAIEQGLITKRVIACDEKFHLTLGELDGSVSGDDHHSLHSTNPNISTCSICLEPFQIDDTLTWSRRSNVCQHVFHTDCLMEWLSNLKHEDCPSCRERLIHFDHVGENDESVAPEPSGRYMVMDGLIRTVRSSYMDVLEPTRLQIAFRRVSSGIYSHLTQTFDLDDDDDMSVEELSRSVPLRRTLSEGVRVQAHRLGISSRYTRLSGCRNDTIHVPSDIPTKACFDISKDHLHASPTLRRTLSDGPSPNRRTKETLDVVSRPGLFATQVCRRSSSVIYANMTSTFEEDDDEEDDLALCGSWREEDDEDSLRIIGRQVLFSDKDDLELGQ